MNTAKFITTIFTFITFTSSAWAMSERINFGLNFEAHDCVKVEGGDPQCDHHVEAPLVAYMDLEAAGDLFFGEYTLGPIEYRGIEYTASVYVTKWPERPLYGFDVVLKTLVQGAEEPDNASLSYFVEDLVRMDNVRLYGTTLKLNGHIRRSSVGLFPTNI